MKNEKHGKETYFTEEFKNIWQDVIRTQVELFLAKYRHQKQPCITVSATQ